MPKRKQMKTRKLKHYDRVVCCFQGGGSLGAYQVGVVKALMEDGYEPNWYVGTSIGAINSAISAGNPSDTRVDRLLEFWDLVGTPTWWDMFANQDLHYRKLQHFLSAQWTISFGQKGFFIPRFPPTFPFNSTPDTLSYYDTAPLEKTLERLIDFDYLNSGITRLSLGAVDISTGIISYFDSENQKITPKHIMASGALPPGFPAVEIDGRYYWDGGLSTNTPVAYAINHTRAKSLLCFMIHLFDSYGLTPKNFDDIEKRKKDIYFSSRFEKTLKMYQEVHQLRYAIHQLSEHLPETVKKKKPVQEFLDYGWENTLSMVRFLYKGSDDELSSKDYEFSKKSIKEHIHSGYKDGKNAIRKSPWLEPVAIEDGFSFHDMTFHAGLEEE